MNDEFYLIVLAFCTNLFLLILSEVLGMSKRLEPNSVTELVASTAAALGGILLEKIKPQEEAQRSRANTQ